ncbi:hypothetical protein MVEN_02530800 [Mycena venus]|uniref:Uncharacterized protein n=1 Tax=Mycena venus TaxID=2733690 RepID=A0A8H7CAC2_9AGAR|nr:hypothetical protein MVEN_02530800 [Mycena venus]
MSSKSASRTPSGPGAALKSTPHGGSSDSFRSRSQRPAMNFGPVATLLTFLVLSCIIAPCRAQTNKIFQWQFAGNALSSSLPSCRSFQIQVKPFNPANNTHGVPPFYMMAFAIGGTPSTTLIGTDESNLQWTVNQPVGKSFERSQLLLQVVDSQGSSGGVPPNLFTVVAGQTTQCIPAASNDPPFTVEANVTDTLTTCQPWGITIKGGVPPYNLTLAAINSPVVTNVTMGPADDHFTFIDRADPNTQLIAAISDLTGRWAVGTPIVKTKGSSNVDCIGLVSSSGNSTVIEAQEKAALATSNARKKTAVVAGVVVTLIVLLLLAAVGVYLYMRRRKMQERSPRQFEAGIEAGIEGSSTEAFQETGTQVLSINAFIAPPSPTATSQPRSPKSPGPSVLSHSVSTSAPSAGPSARRNVAAPESNSSFSSAGSGLVVRNPNLGRAAAFTSFPSASVRRSAKEIEAGLSTAHSIDSEYYDDSSIGSRSIERSRSAAVAGPSAGRGLPTPARSASVGASAAPGEEIIFQHQDAGIVRELPPPYADRGRDP